jgi:hypothetical protein
MNNVLYITYATLYYNYLFIYFDTYISVNFKNENLLYYSCYCLLFNIKAHLL